VLLEPIMDIEVVTPSEYMGDVMGDLNSRRGKIGGMTQREIAAAVNRPQNPSNSVSAATSPVPASISQACRGMRLGLKSGMR